MSPHVSSRAAATATGLVGAVTTRVFSTAGRATVAGITTGLQVFTVTKRVRTEAARHAGHALQLVASTPLGRLLPASPPIHDGADAEAARIASDARSGSPGRPTLVPPADEAQEDQPRQPDIPQAAREVGAPGAATAEVDAVVEQLTSEGLPEEPTRDELPIADFDNASLASLRGRLRALSVEQLALLREYEQAHAHRLPVITMLDNRIAKLAADAPPYPQSGANANGATDNGPGPLRAAADGEMAEAEAATRETTGGTVRP